MSDLKEIKDQFKPRLRVPPASEQRLISERMRTAATGLDVTGQRVLNYFAGLVEERLERTAGPINTVSLWTGIVMGLVAGAILAAMVYNLP